MKLKLTTQIAVVMFVTMMATMTGLSQTTFFSDTFNNGSTLNSTVTPPPDPTVNSANYNIVANGPITPAASITPGNLLFGSSSNSASGVVEVQAMFSTNPIVLASNTDYITIAVTFTNQSILAVGRGYLGMGLYNTGASTNYPVPGGFTNEAVATTTYALNNCQLWQGYFGEQTYSANKEEIFDRPMQTAGANSTDQELLTTGSGNYSSQTPSPGGVSGSPTVGVNSILTNGTYVDVLTITLVTQTSMAITNWMYTNSINPANLITNVGGIATNGTFLTSGFNALAFGWYQKVAAPADNAAGIESINIYGQSTAITGPPTITSQPTNEIVATNGYVQFATAAVGADVAYQWYLNGAPLANAGNYSGVTTGTLGISPAVTTNEATTLDGYYCLVSGALGYTTNTVTNSLTLVAATNLVWVGTTPTADWDVDNSVDWETTNSSPIPVVFTGGDPVSFNDNTVVNATATLVGNVAPASMSVTTANAFTFSGTGSIVGPGYAVFDGENAEGEVQLNANNTFTGGTLLTNGVYVNLQNYNGLGNGPVILGSSSGPTGVQMEIDNTGSASSGVNGNINIAANSTFLVDGTGTFAGVFFGGFSGSPGATLTFEPSVAGAPQGTGPSTNRMRFYGTNTVCNGNIFLDGPSTPQAQYFGDEIAFYNGSGTQTYNGVISGNGGLIVRGNGTAVLSGQNTFSGGTSPTSGLLGLGSSSLGGTGSSVTSGPLGTGFLLLDPEVPGPTATGQIFASGGAQTVGNSIVYNSGTNNLTLETGGSNDLTLSGPYALNGADGNNSTTSRLIESINTGLTTFSGPITDGGLGYSLNFFGSGTNKSTVALSGSDTYTGATTVSNLITLLVNGSLTASSGVTVATNATLGGTGTIANAVTIQNGGNLAAGSNQAGTLHLGGALTFAANATNIVYLNGSGANTAVTASGLVTYAGTLTPVVTSGTITSGQTFTIFNAGSHSGNFTATNGIPGPGMTWYFNPATGILTAEGSSVIVPSIPPHITSFSLSGSNVSITATNGVNGGTYYLLGQTNVALPINQWYPVATNVVTASGGTESFSFTGTNVFSATTSGLFLILSSTNN